MYQTHCAVIFMISFHLFFFSYICSFSLLFLILMFCCRGLEKRPPVRDTVARNVVERLSDARQRSRSLERQSDSWDRKLKRLSPSPRRSPVSEAERETSLIEKRRFVNIRRTLLWLLSFSMPYFNFDYYFLLSLPN